MPGIFINPSPLLSKVEEPHSLSERGPSHFRESGQWTLLITIRSQHCDSLSTHSTQQTGYPATTLSPSSQYYEPLQIRFWTSLHCSYILHIRITMAVDPRYPMRGRGCQAELANNMGCQKLRSWEEQLRSIGSTPTSRRHLLQDTSPAV